MKSARFVVFQDKKNQWRWHLKAGNGRVIAQGESHMRWRDAIRAIEAVRQNVRGLTIIDMVGPGGEREL